MNKPLIVLFLDKKLFIDLSKKMASFQQNQKEDNNQKHHRDTNEDITHNSDTEEPHSMTKKAEELDYHTAIIEYFVPIFLSSVIKLFTKKKRSYKKHYEIEKIMRVDNIVNCG